MRNINKINNISIPQKKIDTLNSSINLSEIAHSIFCNVKNLLIGEVPICIDDLNLNQQLLSNEELGLPANGVFSSKFNDMLKESIDKKI